MRSSFFAALDGERARRPPAAAAPIVCMKSRRFMPGKIPVAEHLGERYDSGMITLLTCVALVAGVKDTAPSVIPRPAHLPRGRGTFVLTARTAIVTDRATRDIGYQLADWIRPATGYRLAVGAAPEAGAEAISIRIDPTLARLGDEGYGLSVTPARIAIRAFRPAGAFYAVETLRQLLPPDIFRAATVAGVSWVVPAVEIEDWPRVSWRGAHLDVSSSFMPKEFVKKYIDLLALHKLNRFHWHLTDDQGWRIEIKKYPLLTSIGGWRRQSLVGVQRAYRDTTQWVYDNIPHGGFYTQDDVREIVLRDENHLQSWMTARMSEWLAAHGRALIGWDEILEGGTEGLAPNAVVMSWRGIDGGVAAAQAGHDVVMTPTSNTYFDYYQSQDAAREPLAIGGFLPLETVYGYEPIPPALDSLQARHVLGTQGQIWTEYQRTPKNVEFMVFPRLVALAEVAWTPREQKNLADFSTRLSTHLSRLDVLDVTYRRPAGGP